MKYLLLFAVAALPFLTSCEKTEYVDREVIVHDTVTVTVTKKDTIYLDKIITETRGHGVAQLEAAFVPYNTEYPKALPAAKKFFAALLTAAPADSKGIVMYMGKYNYSLGYYDSQVTFEVLYIKELSTGVYRAVKAEHYGWDTLDDLYTKAHIISENPNGLPAPQADFAQNTFAAYLVKADVDVLKK